jgi:hypothetical protein
MMIQGDKGRTDMKRWNWLAAIAAVAMIAGTAALAQVPPDLGKMGAQMRRNQEEIRQYSWDMKLTFLINDQLRRSDTYTVRYVMGGQVEKMQINSEVAEGKVRGPDGKKLKKDELEVARQFVIDVKNQLDGYLNPLFAEKAVKTATARTENGKLILNSSDVVTTGDSVLITINQATQRPLTAEIRTTIEGTPVALDVTFDSIEYGPNYPSKSITTSQWQGMKLTIVTETSNYQLGR